MKTDIDPDAIFAPPILTLIVVALGVSFERKLGKLTDDVMNKIKQHSRSHWI